MQNKHTYMYRKSILHLIKLNYNIIVEEFVLAIKCGLVEIGLIDIS